MSINGTLVDLNRRLGDAIDIAGMGVNAQTDSEARLIGIAHAALTEAGRLHGIIDTYRNRPIAVAHDDLAKRHAGMVKGLEVMRDDGWDTEHYTTAAASLLLAYR